MVGAKEGVEGLMILTRRVAALPVTIVLYHDDVFLVHVVSTCAIICFFSSWSMQFLNDSMFQSSRSSLSLNLSLEHGDP